VQERHDLVAVAHEAALAALVGAVDDDEALAVD